MSIRCSLGHENPDGATFCDECGEPLPASTPASTPDAEDEAPTAPAGFTSAEPVEETPVPQPPPAVDFEVTEVASVTEFETIPAPPEPPALVPPPQEASVPAFEAAETVTAVPSEPPAAPVVSKPRLLVEGTTVTFDLGTKPQVIVGREDAPSNSFPDIDLTPFGAEEKGVSRLHAQFTQHGDNWTIEDLESTNFTFVNRKKIDPKTPLQLNDGDEIRLGRIGLRFKTLA